MIRHKVVSGTAVLLTHLSTLGCGRNDASFVLRRDPQGKPIAPLELAAPAPPERTFNGHELSAIDGRKLNGAARAEAHRGRYREAVQFQHWAVAASGDGRYDLACYYGRTGDADAALYWLQQAALDDGVDGEWAERDSDLQIPRRDKRWPQIAAFLKAANEYWAESGHNSTTLVLPKGYQRGTPIGALIGLHGLGSNDKEFVGDNWQPIADHLNFACIGVSGTIPRGARSYVWSEDVNRDATRVRQALEEVSDRVTIDSQQQIVFGFSQGAQMAFELALRNPDEFRGAIVLSPGAKKAIRSETIADSRALRFVIVCGAGEHPSTQSATQIDAATARQAGANVQLKIYQGMNTHSFPPDFDQQLPNWVKFIASSNPSSNHGETAAH